MQSISQGALIIIILFPVDITELYAMWVIVVIFVLLLVCWILFAPLEFKIDTRVPHASLRWLSIGKAIIVYENEKWILKTRLLFFYKQWEVGKMGFGKKKSQLLKKIKPAKKSIKTKSLRQLFSLLKTFRVTQWEIAIDTGDVIKNAWLYSLNFYSPVYHHLFINFSDENYFLLETRTSPWKLAYAFIR